MKKMLTHPQLILTTLAIFAMVVIWVKKEDLDVNMFMFAIPVPIIGSWTAHSIVERKSNKGEQENEKSN